MAKNAYLGSFVFSLLLSACSSSTNFQAGAVRQPAASDPPTPYLPGSGSANNHKPKTKNPVVPPKKDPGPPPRGSGNNNTQDPKNPARNNNNEELVTCEPPIASWRFAYSEKSNHYGTVRTEYSVLDALLRGGGNQAQITESRELDRSILQDWFGKGLNENSSIFKSAQLSGAYKLAFDYINGTEDSDRSPSSAPNLVGARAAIYIATLMAVSENAECMRSVESVGNRMFADLASLPGGKEYKASFDELNRSIRNYLADAKLGKDKQRFQELDSNHHKFENDLANTERQVRLQESTLERNTKNFEAALQRQARKVDNMIAQIGPCTNTSTNITASSALNEIEFLNNRIKDCIASAQQRIDRYETKKSDLESRGKEDSSVYRDTLKTLERWQNELAPLTSEQPGSAQQIVAQMREDAKTYSSIQTQIEQLQAEKAKLQQQNQRLVQNTTPWLTHGYLGRFLVK